jgi:hypothetical protein
MLSRQLEYRGRRLVETITPIGDGKFILRWRDSDDPSKVVFTKQFVQTDNSNKRGQEAARRRCCDAYEKEYFSDIQRVGLDKMIVNL